MALAAYRPLPGCTAVDCSRGTGGHSRIYEPAGEPAPSFAPEANTGYAITYERQYFTLDSDLLAGLTANHNGEVSADGWLPMHCGINGFLHLPDEDEMNRYSRAVRGFDSWGELTAATDLPLAQNALLDTEANNFAAVSLYPSGMIEIPEEYDGRPTRRKRRNTRPGLSPLGAVKRRTSSTCAPAHAMASTMWK